MSTPSSTRITIVGAGLAGSLLACALGRRGYRVEVYERRPDPRVRGFIGGRSINLALSTRGIEALRGVGLDEAVLADAIPMRGRMMHAVSGELAFQPYSKNPREAINSVSRGGLNLVLLNAADELDNVTLNFSHRCLDIEIDNPAAQFLDELTGSEGRRESDVIVGADGAFSAVRSRLQRTDRFDFSQTYLEHGYKELTIPPAPDGGFALDPGALHIWPQGGAMMIALPNPDCTFTCTLFWPFSGPGGFTALADDGAVRAHFEAWYPDAVPLIPTLVEDYRENPASSLVTVRCRPWHHDDRIVLVGDAAHAIVPFFGQGMNAAFEDCAELDACLEAHGSDWGRVFEEYTRRRKANGDAIADLALRNFIEMRDKVGSRGFRLRKRMEKLLHRWAPWGYTPLYNMVSFTTIPYAEARRRAVAQDRLIAALLAAALVVLLAVIVVVLLSLG